MTKNEKAIMRQFILAMRTNIGQSGDYEFDLSEVRLYNKARELVSLPPIPEPSNKQRAETYSAFYEGE